MKTVTSVKALREVLSAVDSTGIGPVSYTHLHTVQINSLEDLKAYFRYDPERDIIVSGHRGGMMPGYPERCV